MRKIVGYLTHYFRHECNKAYLVALMVFVAVCTYVAFFIITEKQWIEVDPDHNQRLLKYIAGYGVVFGGAWLLQILFEPREKSLRTPGLWALIVMAVVLFSVRAWVYQYVPWVQANVLYAHQTVVQKIIINLEGFLLLGIPCAVYWFFADRGRQPLYGFKTRGVTLWPYFILLLGMMPLLLAASTQTDFQEAYPRAARLAIPPNDPQRGLLTAIYEVCYSIDFVVTEFFFRGFLILAFLKYAGHRAILPMCAFYVSIHFDKPLGEAISSFFGGLILGVLAYRTGSIYGGIIVHLGIALAMEVIGWWAR
jgi:membrane protease YdiL (CAAX protease family)